MSSNCPRPDRDKALGTLCGFQRRTVEHVVQQLVAPGGWRRFLVADEVGLGKTLVARGVIAEFVERHWDDVGRLDIVYLCSNGALARENVRKLRVGGDETSKVIEATRFTLMPTMIEAFHPRLNFISLTPGTAMKTMGGGIQDERRVLYHLLRARCAEGRWLGNLLRGQVGLERWRSRLKDGLTIDEQLAEGFQLALSERRDLLQSLEEMKVAFARVDAVSAREASSDAYRLIGHLRNLLARVCIDAVQPDLIILDEFQRFKDLMAEDEPEPSPAADLARQLFSYLTPEGNRVALLLLSATPYRMFTTSEESATDDHYRDFLDTLRFLVADEARFARVKALLGQYREELVRAAAGQIQGASTTREELQAELLRVMCRRERVGSTEDRESMVAEKPHPATLEQGDVDQYLALEKLREHTGSRDVMELWKSAPYLLNFARGYQFKAKFEDGADVAAVHDAFAEHPDNHLDSQQVDSYAEVELRNGRLRVLERETLAQDQWKMLWLPPSHPYWPLEGPWARNPGLTKTLLFSSWNVVPDAISALLSYEAERRRVGGAEGAGGVSYADLSDRHSPLLTFAVEGDRARSMTTLALQLPCLRLASIHPLTLVGDHGEVRAAMRARLEPLVAELEGLVSMRDRVQRAPYATALLLLDRADRELPAFLRELGTRGGAGIAAHAREGLEILEKPDELGAFPADLLDALVDFALGSPAVAWARTLSGSGVTDAVRRTLAAQMAEAFRSLFNEASVVRMLQREDGGRYWQSTLRYATSGNLQAVLDEYSHLLWEPEAWAEAPPDETALVVTQKATEAITTKTSHVRPDYYRSGSDGIAKLERGTALRAQFALRYGNLQSGSESQEVREDAVRDAFKSPFYPFVLASTSVGQEGLDFHPWCHSVWHWNLPGNPVDLEQREGRVHRYKGHAVRKNVAASHGGELPGRWAPGQDPWEVLFDLAEQARTPEQSELVPGWLAPGPHRVERCVPMLPLSREGAQLARLKRSLAIYRVVFGQPRQSELVQLLDGGTWGPEEMDRWVVRLEV